MSNWFRRGAFRSVIPRPTPHVHSPHSPHRDSGSPPSPGGGGGTTQQSPEF